MKCPLTGSDNWENVDNFRFKPEGMCINKDSGFVSYPERFGSDGEAKDYYRQDYRKAPSVSNLYTGEKKLHYHSFFLKDWIEEFKGKKPVIGEVGAAYGLFLNFMKQALGGDCEIYGTEWTKSFKRNAWHEFNIRLDDELRRDKEYDLITLYHVHEHQKDPGEKLRHYRDLLKDGGFLYVSCPMWFHRLYNFGGGAYFELEEYYHPDHINVWSRPFYEELLRANGLEVVKEDHFMYESTYLLKKADKYDSKPRLDKIPSYDSVMEWLEKIYNVALLTKQEKIENYEKALEIWPNFPFAYQFLIERKRAELHKKGGFDAIQRAYLEPMMKHCPDSIIAYSVYSDIAVRYNRFKEALDVLKEALAKSPNNSSVLLNIGHVFLQMAEYEQDPEKKVSFYEKAREAERVLKRTSSDRFADAVNWIYFCNSKIPTPFESEVKDG